MVGYLFEKIAREKNPILTGMEFLASYREDIMKFIFFPFQN